MSDMSANSNSFKQEKIKFKNTIKIISETDSSVSVVSGYGLDDRAIEVRSPAEAKRFFL
jgi:hypothetical protein